MDGYVFVTIDWYVHERFRWESDASADIDNILKPLLDAFCGPEGVLIDDAQIKRLCCQWHSITSDLQRVDVDIEFIENEWIPKAGLRFVQVKDALCYPVPGEVVEKKAIAWWIVLLKTALSTRSALERVTGDYYPARYVLPPGFFHKSRLKQFEVMDLSEFETEAGDV